MKKILIILMLFLSSIIYADTIPGFLEMDLNYTNYEPESNISKTNIDIVYGGTFKWFKPYVFVSWETFFKYKSLGSNYPFQDIYRIGTGFLIKEIFYFEYEHGCSHPVISKYKNGNPTTETKENDFNFEGLLTGVYDSFKVGIKIKID